MPDKKDCDFQGEKEIKVRSEGVIFPQDMWLMIKNSHQLTIYYN